MRHRLIQGPPTPESAWLPWLAAAQPPARALRYWLPARARLVVVAPHPDDELLACGALLAMHQARGGASVVLALTDGEASHAGSPQWTASALATARRAERTEGLARLGLRGADVRRFGLPDGALSAQAGTLAQRLGALLRATDVVVSPWRCDGHPDHDAAGHAAAAACATAGCRLLEAPVWMWHWAVPGDERVPWQRLRGLQVGAAVLAQKQHALAAHVSQLGARTGVTAGAVVRNAGPVLDAAIMARARRATEYFFV